MEVQLGRRILIADVGKVRHTAGKKILSEAVLNRLFCHNKAIQVYELRKGERINDELYIASAEIG